MEWLEPIEETIRKRRSVRTFNDIDVEEEKKEEIQRLLDEINNGADGAYRILWLDIQNLNGKVGTYGMISGAKNYLVGVVSRQLEELELFGNDFEKVILFATQLGLGTCWLGGVDRKSFEEKIDIEEMDLVAVASPVGYPKDRRSLKESMIRRIAGSDSRIPWEILFYEKAAGQPLPQVNAGKYALPLEMARIAPSASNKQPWRVVRNEKGFHFCLLRNQGYAGKLPFDIQRSDVGIAMCHFEQTAIGTGLAGKWVFDKDAVFGSDLITIKTWIPG